MLVFLDLETTGFDNTKDHILEISAVRWDGEKNLETYDTLVQIPEHGVISSTVEELTGITHDMIEQEGVPLREAIAGIQEFLREDDVIVGHNISFDTGFLKQNGVMMENQEIDTFILSILILGQDEESHSLEILTQKYGFVHENAHRAMSDVLANIEIYKFFQHHWQEKSYSKTLFNTILQYSGKAVFPEHLFFLDEENKRSKYISQELPVSTFPKFVQSWEDSTATFEEVYNESKDGKKVLYQTPFPEQQLKNIVEKSITNNQQICIVFPKQKTQKFLEYYDSLLPLFPDNTLEWHIPEKTSIDNEKWELFLEKTEFNREESIVLFKILRAKELGTENKLRFMRDEWSTARGLEKNKIDTFSCESSVLFCTIEDLSMCQDSRTEYIFESDTLDDVLTELYTQKIFSKRILEDIQNGSPEDEKKEKNIFAPLTKILRDAKGENQYSIHIPFKQAHSILGYSQTVADFLEIDLSQYSAEVASQIAEIQKFFQLPEEENSIKSLELFPDNYLAFEKTPIFLDEYFSKLIEKNIGQVFIGKSFPWYGNDIVFPFQIPEEVLYFKEPISLPPVIDIPDINRTATPAESLEFVEECLNDNLNVLFIANSKKVAESVVDMLRDTCDTNNIMLLSQRAGSVGKMRVNLQKDQQKILVATSRYLDMVRIEDFDFQAIAMLKAPFDPPKNLLQTARKQYMGNDFDEFSIPRAKAKVVKDRTRVKNVQRWFFGDGRASDKRSWASTFAK